MRQNGVRSKRVLPVPAPVRRLAAPGAEPVPNIPIYASARMRSAEA
jgi:hypothetical protein